MFSIEANNVTTALKEGLSLLRVAGYIEKSRNGDVTVLPSPMVTTYTNPQARVLLDEKRDANPFLFLFDALWVLGGRQDTAFLTMFAKRFYDFSDDGKRFHGAYGHRLRSYFGMDQLEAIVKMLRESKTSRRAVLQIWDCALDLGTHSKDIPCNDLIFCSINGEDDSLDITVCNRSNDAIWGAYGANAVQFSMLQEYIAGRLGVKVGKYRQFSNNFHAYEWNEYWKWFRQNGALSTYEDPPKKLLRLKSTW
jgi:thymidylate synthase